MTYKEEIKSIKSKIIEKKLFNYLKDYFGEYFTFHDNMESNIRVFEQEYNLSVIKYQNFINHKLIVTSVSYSSFNGNYTIFTIRYKDVVYDIKYSHSLLDQLPF